MITSEYTKDFQIALVTNLFHDEELYKYASDRITIEDFDLTACKLIYEVMHAYYDEYSKLPSFDILLLELEKRTTYPELSKVQVLPEEMESLTIVLERVNLAKPLDAEYFKANIPGYLIHVRGAKVVSAHVQNKSPDMNSFVDQMVQLRATTDKGGDLKFLNASVDLYPVLSHEDLRKIGFGVSNLEKVAAKGLRTGGLGMVTACSGVGKTNTLLNFARGAIWEGYRCLFITLELAASRIVHRYIAMVACLRAGLLEVPMKDWDDEDLELYAYVNQPSYKYYGMLDIIDMSQRSIYTVDSVDRYIDEWMTNISKQYGDEEVKKCKGVYVDWLDRLVQAPRHKYLKSHEYLPKYLEELGNISKRYDVATWTATQAVKEADGAAQLKMNHTAFSSHKSDALDLGIGVAPVFVDTVQTTIPDSSFKEDGSAKNQFPDCNKSLNYNINKNRDSMVGDVILYQGPSLRLFNNQQEWLNLKGLLNGRNFEVLG